MDHRIIEGAENLRLKDVERLRGLLLTRDAHELYRRFGFKTQCDRSMARDPDR